MADKEEKRGQDFGWRVKETAVKVMGRLVTVCPLVSESKTAFPRPRRDHRPLRI